MRRPVSPPPKSSAAVDAAAPARVSAARAAVATLLLCAAYYAGGLIGISLRFQPGQISGIWLPHGILVAALLAAPVRRWWLYAAALLPTHVHLVSTFQAPIPVVVILIQFAGNITAAGVAAALLRRMLGQPPRLDTLSRMGAFMAVAAVLLPCVVSAVVVRLFVATGWVADFWIGWQRRTLTGMCGAVIIAAPMLQLATGGLAAIRRVSARQVAEFASLTVALVALLAVSSGASTHAHRQWLLFTPLPLLLWSAVRFGPGGLGVHLLAVALVTMLTTKAGRGPFATGSTPEMVVGLQLFFLSISIPLMLLAALVRQYAQTAADLRVAEALRDIDRRKDEFLAMLAHELRNPLAPIALAAEMIRMREPTDETIVSAEGIISRQTGQLTRLVDDLLDVSRIRLGKINLNLAVVDVRQIIARAVEATQPLLTARNHALSIEVPDRPLPIRGDAARLTQIIANLLNNAAKYTQDGGSITLGARVVAPHVVVSVADSGVGIPAPMLERVFDLFTQLDSTRDRSQDGLGIGLALVKRLVEMHDGDIEARSEGAGRGSEMVVRFPLASEPAIPVAPPAGEGGAGAPAPARPLRIMVVDDNVDSAESLSRVLRLHRHEVVVAHDGLTALAAAPVMKPDVVLLDLGMPDLDGLEVARRLRALDDGARALLVAITGFGQAQDRASTAAAGFDHHLTKPVDPQVLQALLQAGRPVDHV